MRDYIMLAMKSMKHRQLRSYLTIIGVVIGVTALVSLITLGQGMQAGITEEFDKFGTNVLWIGPKTASAFGGAPQGIGSLTEEDSDHIERMTIIDFTSPMIVEGADVEYNREKIRRDIFAPRAERMRDLLENVDIKIAEGRHLEKGDKDVTVIGWNVHKDMFDKELPLKSSILINDKKFRVVGIKEETGSRDEDNQISIPLSTMQDMLGETNGISAFAAIIHAGVDADDAAEKIARELERKRGDENFEVTSPVKIQAQLGEVLAVVKWVVAAIASISLLVGGLGIMNTMYSSVLQRTREIGVMKAIGATNKDILWMFLLESGFIGFVGGFIGLVVGLLISFGAKIMIQGAGGPKILIEVDYQLMIFGLMFAFLLGMASGAVPAMRAAKMNPTQALRYE